MYGISNNRIQCKSNFLYHKSSTFFHKEYSLSFALLFDNIQTCLDTLLIGLYIYDQYYFIFF